MEIEAGAQVTPSVKLLRQLGEGGMGAVWVAEHKGLGTEVAVKFLLGEFANDESARARFSQEAAAASQVKSSHVVKIYDYGITDTNVPFIVMELLEGTDLSKRIATEGALPPHDVAVIVTQLCRALERAHEKGVVHRDIKPENIFLGSEGGEVFVKLLDFGVAKTERTLNKKTTGSRRSTMAGESLGTPYYMSPEQFKSSKSIDFRSDLWSVGVVVYEALTGSLPFVADTVGALAIVVNEAVAPPPSVFAPSLPRQVDAWFAMACARDPADRFASARALSDALRAALGEVDPTRFSSPDASAPRVVVTRPSDAEALRETAFATSGGASLGSSAAIATPQKKRPIVAAVLGALVVLGIGGGLALTLRAPAPHASSGSDPSLSSTPPSDVPSSLAVTPRPDPTTSAALPPIVTPPVVVASGSSRGSATGKPPTTGTKPTSSAPTPPPSAAPSGGSHERDIW